MASARTRRCGDRTCPRTWRTFVFDTLPHELVHDVLNTPGARWCRTRIVASARGDALVRRGTLRGTSPRTFAAEERSRRLDARPATCADVDDGRVIRPSTNCTGVVDPERGPCRLDNRLFGAALRPRWTRGRLTGRRRRIIDRRRSGGRRMPIDGETCSRRGCSADLGSTDVDAQPAPPATRLWAQTLGTTKRPVRHVARASRLVDHAKLAPQPPNLSPSDSIVRAGEPTRVGSPLALLVGRRPPAEV